MSETVTDAAELTRAVTEVVAGELGIAAGDLAPETDLQGVEGADSIKVLRIIARIEQRFEVELEDSDVFGVRTVADVVAVLRRSLEGEPAA